MLQHTSHCDDDTFVDALLLASNPAEVFRAVEQEKAGNR